MPHPPLLGFSTLGAPDLSFREAAQLMSKAGLAFLELRALEGTLDLPKYFCQQNPPLPAVCVRVIDTSFSLLEATAADEAHLLACAKLARDLHAPYLRLFGAATASAAASVSPRQLDTAAAWVRKLRASLSRESYPCELLLETHDVFSSSPRCISLNERLESPLSLLWDTHHTWRFAGEQPSSTWKAIGPWVRHIHYKDSIANAAAAEGVEYVAPGEGGYPIDALRRAIPEFSGGISLEWERLWHPELTSIDRVLPLFINQFRPTPS